MRKNLGFTLIELLVVVSIISLLSSIVLAAVNDARDKAKGTAFRQHVEEFKKAVELYRVSHNGQLYTTTSAQTGWGRINSTNSSGLTGTVYVNNFNSSYKEYIAEFPIPAFSGTFRYETNWGNCNGSNIFLLISGTENKKYFEDWYEFSQTFQCYPLN